jgi:integrase
MKLEHRQIRVARAFSHGRLDTAKSGHGRTVDMSHELAERLRRLSVERKAETLRRGWRELPPWVFASTTGTPLDRHNVDKAFKRALKAATLPAHFSPHALRHSFASLLLQQGESPTYVQRQLGHASIQLTADTYGRHLPLGNKAAVDRLDGPSGSKTVAPAMGTDDATPQPVETSSAPGVIRTRDPRIRNPVLYPPELRGREVKSVA